MMIYSMPLILMLSTSLSTFFVNGSEINSKTLKNIIREEKRFILFNSRRLTGECCKYYYLSK
jgi:hypothetical protein